MEGVFSVGDRGQRLDLRQRFAGARQMLRIS
jgi:hypothetical protein